MATSFNFKKRWFCRFKIFFCWFCKFLRFKISFFVKTSSGIFHQHNSIENIKTPQKRQKAWKFFCSSSSSADTFLFIYFHKISLIFGFWQWKKRSHAICLCALFLQANIYAKAFEEAHSLLSPGVLTHTNNVNASWWIFILVAEQKICSIFLTSIAM